MATYSRGATCTRGAHRIELRFTWDPDIEVGEPTEYSKPCPVAECSGRVEFRLPIGADPESLRMMGP